MGPAGSIDWPSSLSRAPLLPQAFMRLSLFFPFTTEAKAALGARHGGQRLQFVAADGGEGLEDYDAVDWTGPSLFVGIAIAPPSALD